MLETESVAAAGKPDQREVVKKLFRLEVRIVSCSSLRQITRHANYTHNVVWANLERWIVSDYITHVRVVLVRKRDHFAADIRSFQQSG